MAKTTIKAAHLQPGMTLNLWRGLRYIQRTVAEVAVSPDRPGGRIGAYPEVGVTVRYTDSYRTQRVPGDKDYELVDDAQLAPDYDGEP
jgi:hypothetical protein